jgi:signal transduction histidine kinase
VRDACLEVEARGCSVKVDGKLTGKITGDRELLRRAVENVLRNAVRYSPPKAYIDIVLREQNGTASIAIRDYGSGIPEAFLEKIFDPFFRVEEARDSETGGIGLGLSIAKRAVQLHNGTILAQNANPGLSVQITLPLTDEKKDAIQPKVSSDTVSSVNNS